MRYETTVDIATTTDRVWAAWLDIERWPEWTASVTSAQRLDPGDFRVGSRVRIKQPKMRLAVWQVTQVQPGRSFVWTTRTGGLRMVADHTVEPSASGVGVSLTFDLDGPLAGLLGRFAGGRIRGYLRTEADGLKAYCEA